MGIHVFGPETDVKVPSTNSVQAHIGHAMSRSEFIHFIGEAARQRGYEPQQLRFLNEATMRWLTLEEAAAVFDCDLVMET